MHPDPEYEMNMMKIVGDEIVEMRPWQTVLNALKSNTRHSAYYKIKTCDRVYAQSEQ